MLRRLLALGLASGVGSFVFANPNQLRPDLVADVGDGGVYRRRLGESCTLAIMVVIMTLADLEWEAPPFRTAKRERLYRSGGAAPERCLRESRSGNGEQAAFWEASVAQISGTLV